mgnify:CR=1 FL=1
MRTDFDVELARHMEKRKNLARIGCYKRGIIGVRD